MIERGLVVRDLGLMEYSLAYETQKSLVEKKKKDKALWDEILFVEHPGVYTYGRKNKGALLPNAFEVERGGEVTFHNPGQLVCYPILSLSESERDLHLYLRKLEETIIDVLMDFKISATRKKGATGVWLREETKKIASIGVAVSGWVTYHGCALNVDNDLKGFSAIQPCGFDSSVMTSMKAELGDKCPPMAHIKDSFLAHFGTHFGRRLAA